MHAWEIFVSTGFSFLASIGSLMVLGCPFVFFDMPTTVIVTFLLGAVFSFVLGSYVGKLGEENIYWTGLKYAILAIVVAVISHIVGDLLQVLV